MQDAAIAPMDVWMLERQLRLHETTDYQAVLDAFIQHVPNLVVVKDVEGRYLAVNPLAERSYGVPRAQLLGKTAEEALPVDFATECGKDDNIVLCRETVCEVEQTYPWPDGAHTFHTVKFPIFDSEQILVGTGAIGIDITQHRRIESGLYQRANFDAVTELPNRRLVMDRLDQSMALARRTGTLVGLLLLDVGDFTGINETLGHVAADALLGSVASTLRGLVRETDTVGRVNGDVFSVLLPNIRNVSEMTLVAEKILNALKSPHKIDEVEIFPNPSIGLAYFPSDSNDGQDLMRCAKMALDHAKARGRSCIAPFNSALSGQFVRRTKIANHLRSAIDHNELTLAYQPIVDTKSGEVVSIEALLRWTNSELGVVNPAEFIPVAEDAGLINSIGAWAFRTACADAEMLNRGRSSPIVVAVNFSVKQLGHSDIVSVVDDCLKEASLDPGLMKVEMTESAFAEDVTVFQGALEGLRGLGMGAALDDFGTGYSSLAYLYKYRFTQLKIDKSFVDNITLSNDGRLLVESIIRMAHSLRLEIVAEGVESEEQAQLLTTLGCDLLQGYLISKPVPVTEIQRMIERQNT